MTKKKEPFTKAQMDKLMSLLNHEVKHMQISVKELWKAVRALNGKDFPTHTEIAKKDNPNARYCVIGDKALAQCAVSRTWFKSQANAEFYARQLMQRQGGLRANALCVVKVVSVVHTADPKIAVTPVDQYDLPF